MKKIIEIRLIGESNARAYRDSTKYSEVTKDIIIFVTLEKVQHRVSESGRELILNIIL